MGSRRSYRKTGARVSGNPGWASKNNPIHLIADTAFTENSNNRPATFASTTVVQP